MRHLLRSMAAFLLVISPVMAQSIDLKIVKLNDKGVVEVTKTISQPTEYTYTMQRPVQVPVIVNGQQVIQVQMVTETRKGIRMTQTSAYVPLDDKDADFADLQGKATPYADVKKLLEKGPIAVIAVPKGDPLPGPALLQAFKADTLVLRVVPEGPPTGKKTETRIKVEEQPVLPKAP